MKVSCGHTFLLLLSWSNRLFEQVLKTYLRNLEDIVKKLNSPEGEKTHQLECIYLLADDGIYLGEKREGRHFLVDCSYLGKGGENIHKYAF